VRTLALAVLLVGACEPPPLTIRYRLTDGEAQKCTGDTGNETTECADITMDCKAVLSIRIVPPDDPEQSYVSICKELPTTGSRKLCSIAGPDLPQPDKPIPERVLEVQLAVFPSEAVPVIDGELVCPIVKFGVDGLPVENVNCASADSPECKAFPAVGGRAFYHPGDSETLIELGCSNLELLRGEKCNGINRTEVIATVNEFEYPGSVDLLTANRLFVSIGEPVPGSMNNHTLDSSQTHLLPRVMTDFPTWSNEFVDLNLLSTYCIETLEDAPMATRTLTCRNLPLSYPGKIDAVGTRLKPDMLATILKAANLTAFPSKGLVVGIVLNQQFVPVANTTVTASCAPTCTVKYLSADKLSFTTGAGASTSTNGIWISEDAPYTSTFARAGQPATTTFGGLVDNKVTVVVIQENTTTGGG
jgi:hypothetical protein